MHMKYPKNSEKNARKKFPDLKCSLEKIQYLFECPSVSLNVIIIYFFTIP